MKYELNYGKAPKHAPAELVAKDYDEEDDYGSGLEDGEVPGYMDSDEEEPIEQMRVKQNGPNPAKKGYRLNDNSV